MKRLIIRITGRVQGVFFRATTEKYAASYGIKGFVKNLKDGSVYIEAEGDNVNLNKFLDYCRQGPPEAVVNDIDIEEAPLKNFTSFEVTY